MAWNTSRDAKEDLGAVKIRHGVHVSKDLTVGLKSLTEAGLTDSTFILLGLGYAGNESGRMMKNDYAVAERVQQHDATLCDGAIPV